jgi:NADH-quinone oxidoreductase subunit C
VTTASVLDVLRTAMPGVSFEEAPAGDMPTLIVDRDHVLELCRVLRTHPDLQFALFVDVTATDVWPREPRFEIVYHVACLGAAFTVEGASSPAPARRLRFKTRLTGDDPVVDTVTSVYPAAGWPEREVFDLFGVTFHGHADLRRILMPEDWQGYPLRRDYPVQVKKDATAWQPVQITAEEFAANVKAQREHAERLAKGEVPPSAGPGGRPVRGAGR